LTSGDTSLGIIVGTKGDGQKKRSEKGVRNRLLTFGNSFGIFHGSWDDQRERQMVG